MREVGETGLAVAVTAVDLVPGSTGVAGGHSPTRSGSDPTMAGPRGPWAGRFAGPR
jgi:hypothetical protein